MIRICREGTWTNNRLNCSSTRNLVEQLRMQEALIKAATSTGPTQTISKATYQTLRKPPLETRNHEETHHILEDLPTVQLKFQLVVSVLAKPVTSHNIHKQPRILAPPTQTSTWTSWALRAVAITPLEANLAVSPVLSNRKPSIACKTNINKCNNFSKCSKWCSIQITRLLTASKEPRVTQKDKATTWWQPAVQMGMGNNNRELNHVEDRELATAKTVLGKRHKHKCNIIKTTCRNN